MNQPEPNDKRQIFSYQIDRMQDATQCNYAIKYKSLITIFPVSAPFMFTATVSTDNLTGFQERADRIERFI
jgi:hypothetical protein